MPFVTSFTRRQFYDLVWSKPMIKLGEELGVSDVALIKICRKHKIARPPQGHWNRVLAGRPVRQIPLGNDPEPDEKAIYINSPYVGLSDEAMEVIQSAKAKVKTAKRQSMAASVALTEPLPMHPVLTRTAEAIRKAKPDKSGLVRPGGERVVSVAVSQGCIERALAILSALAYQFEEQGHGLKVEQSALQVNDGADGVSITMEELVRYDPHVLTEKERNQEERWQERQEKAHRLNTYRWDPKPEFPKFDPAYTGWLSLKIPGYDRGLRRTWNDGKRQKLEVMLDTIVIGVGALISHRRVHREESEERSRQWAEECRCRDIADQHVKREVNRKAYLDEILSLHDEISRLRSWVTQTQALETIPPALERMISWTNERLEMLQKRVSAEQIETRLNAAALFPDEDHLIYCWSEQETN